MGRSFRVRISGRTCRSRWHATGECATAPVATDRQTDRQSPGDGHPGLTFRLETREWVGLKVGGCAFSVTTTKSQAYCKNRTSPDASEKRLETPKSKLRSKSERFCQAYCKNRTSSDTSEKRLETPKSKLRSESERFWGEQFSRTPPPSDVPGDSYLENQVDTSPGGPRRAGASADCYTPGNLPHLHNGTLF